MSDSKDLRAIAQPAHEPFFWARLYGRRLSWPVTRLALKTPLSANAISVLSIVVGAGGGACFAARSVPWNIAGVLLLLLSWVLDCVDGEVARARGQTSLDGEFIDACRHQIVCPALFGGLALGAFAGHPDGLWLVALGLSSTVLSSRFVGGMIDQMVLAGVRRAIRRGELPEREAGATAEARRGALARLRRWITPLFVDFNILHLLLAAVVVDAAGVRFGAGGGITLLDAVHVGYGVAFPVVKLGSMVLAWREGVSGRVEDVLRGRSDEAPHH